MSITPRKPRNDAPQSIRLACRNCGVELIANARDAGKTATCPECGNRIAIPGRAARAREETPTPPGRPFPGQAARAEKESLKLQDEVRAEAAAKQPPPRPSEPNAPGREAPPKAAGGKRQTEAARTRARIAGWLRRAVIVVLALTVLKVFDATFAALVVRAPANLHAAVRGMGDALRAIPSDLHNLAVRHPQQRRHLVLGRHGRAGQHHQVVVVRALHAVGEDDPTTHAVPEHDALQTGIFPAGDADQGVEIAGVLRDVPHQHPLAAGAAVPAMVQRVGHQPRVTEGLRDVVVPAGVLAETVGQHDHRARRSVRSPDVVDDAHAANAVEITFGAGRGSPRSVGQ